MKGKKLIKVLFSITILGGIVSCGSSNDDSPSSTDSIISSNNQSTGSIEDSSILSDSINENISEESKITESSIKESVDEHEKEIASYKDLAIKKLDEIVKPYIESIENVDLKSSVANYYQKEMKYLMEINDLNDAKDSLDKVIQDTKDFINNSIIPLAISKINEIINPLIDKITYDKLQISVKSFYDKEIEKISSIESIEDINTIYNEIIDDTKQFIKDEGERMLVELKNQAVEKLNPYVNELINKIPYEKLKDDTQKFYENEKKKIEAIEEIDDIDACVEEIKMDLERYALNETKKMAVSKLDEVINSGIDKLPNEELANDLRNFSKKEIVKLNSSSTIDELSENLEIVLQETQEHIKKLLTACLKDYYAKLTQIETTTAYDYLPLAMQPSYSKNIVDSTNVTYDFTSFINVSDLFQAGYGEQWQMVIDNINQSVAMAKVFNVVQTALSSAGNAIDIYLQNSPSNDIDYAFTGDDYSARITFTNMILSIDFRIKNEVTIPVAGIVKPIIRMEYDILNESKGMFIDLGDAYKVKYVISKNSYEMCSHYGVTIAGNTGSRSTCLVINEQDDSNVVGSIYEFTTLNGQDKIKACANFYIKDGYVSVVGNKSSGMIGFDGYICELYLANEGRLLGYEVREEITMSGVTGTYNTLWFNIWDIQGIDSIKITDKSDKNTSGKSVVDTYLNDSQELLVPTYNTKFKVKTSRKYDVEYRKRYYYTYDLENDKYVCNEVSIPMFFIQEGDNFTSFEKDVKNDNNIDLSVKLNQQYLNKILDDYDKLIDIFIENKEQISSEYIDNYLKQFE